MDPSTRKPYKPHERSHRHAVQSLQYRTRALWLLGLYILLIVIPWVLTCVLAHRPLNSGSYIRQRGFLEHKALSMRNWYTAVDVLNSIAGLITIPILSAVLAQAAVLFCQRRKPNEFLSLRDMFILADRGWTNVPLIWNSIRSRQKVQGRKSSVGFLLPAACLVLIGAIQQPLYQILVEVSQISVATCRDIPSWHHSADDCTAHPRYERIGNDVEPAQMALAQHSIIRSRMTSELTSISVDEAQSHLWSVNTTFRPMTNYYASIGVGTTSLRYWVFMRNDISLQSKLVDEPIPDFFVAGLPAETATGVLRQHIMRLNSSISCEEVDAGEFPSRCPGEQPLTVFWKRFLDTEVRICVPGDYTAFPWSLRRSRQDLTEEMYIDVKDLSISDQDTEDPTFNTSSTVRCTATTTRGYFELGNNWNNNTYGPLLEHWPKPAEMAENFNDWTDSYGDCPDVIPSDIDACFNKGSQMTSQDVNPSDKETWRIPGPLMTTALALFANGSWLNTAAENVSNHSYNGTYQTGGYFDEIPSWQLFWRGLPFSNLWTPGNGYNELEWKGRDFVSQCGYFEERTFDDIRITNHDLFETTQQFFAAFAPGFNGGKNQTLDTAQSLLEIAIFVANRAFVTWLSPDSSRNTLDILDGRHIYTSPGAAVPKPVLSKSSIIIMSVLIGLQLLGLGYLIYYLYRVPSWSDQLDAMAMARIGASLHHRGVLPAIGPVSKQDLNALQTVGGLIGIVEKSPRRDSSASESVLPDLAATDGSAVELQRLTSPEHGASRVRHSVIGVELGLDAPVPILTTSQAHRSLYVPGMKRLWRGLFASGKTTPIDD